jgi:hypothetical protein
MSGSILSNVTVTRKILNSIRLILVSVRTLAKRKTFTLSITRFVYLIYIVRLITGMTPRTIFEKFLTGNIKDEMIGMAITVMDRLEADGISIAVEGTFSTLIMEWFRRAIGKKQLLRLGPLRITA